MTSSESSDLTTTQLIKHYRLLRGWNQSELAKRIGISPQSVQAWESHDTTPRARIIPRVAEVLGVQARAPRPSPLTRSEIQAPLVAVCEFVLPCKSHL